MSLNLNDLVGKQVLCKLPGFDMRGVFMGVSDNFNVYAIKEDEKTVLVPANMAIIIEIPERKPFVRPNAAADKSIVQ